MGQYKGQPTKRIEDLPNHGDTAQIKGILLNPGLIFPAQNKERGVLASVNDTTEKTAPKGAIDQIWDCLSQIMHAFAEANKTAKIFMLKWDIKDGFWHLACIEGEENNFAYVLPQPKEEPIRIVISTSLQMGWVKSPAYFYAATETARDVAKEYIEMPVTSLRNHKFVKYTIGNKEYEALPTTATKTTGFLYMVEVYVNDFMSLVIPILQEHLLHVAMAVMMVIYDVFPLDDNDTNDPISERKLIKDEGRYSTQKMLLGFDFKGLAKTMWLDSAKKEKLLTLLKSWIRVGMMGMAGIPFKEFELVMAKTQPAFTCIPAGAGLLSPCNRILKLHLAFVYLHKNCKVLTTIKGCQYLLHNSTLAPTQCHKLMCGWPDYIGIVDASSYSVRGVVFGELSACTPMVLRWKWPEDIRANIKHCRIEWAPSPTWTLRWPVSLCCG
jgi:hypothetical protein